MEDLTIAKPKSRRTSKVIARGATAVEGSGQYAWFLDTDGFFYFVDPEQYKTKISYGGLHDGDVVCLIIAETNRQLLSVIDFSTEALESVAAAEVET